MAFTEAELRRIINQLARPRGENDEGGRFGHLHSLIRTREQHFFNRPEADQRLRPPFDDMDVFQSDILRRTWVRMKSRMTESPPIVKVIPPKDSPTNNRDANTLEAVLQRGLDLVQERGDFSIQGELADGQIMQCYGVLHWRRALEVWPDFPELLDGETEQERLDRDARAKARAGFPYHMEVVHPAQFSFIEDRSVANGMGLAVVLRQTPMIDYAPALREQDGLHLSVNEGKSEILLFEEKDRPADWEPSHDMRWWTHNVIVAQVWDRKNFYELVALHDGGIFSTEGFKLVKSDEHSYGMPPFALAKADEAKTPDPALRYTPAMEGLYRIKPFYDYERSLGRAIAEQTALPFYWIKQSDGSFALDDDGNRIVLSQNALAAQSLPAGAELVKVEFNMNPAFVQFLQLTSEELEQAAPQTGQVEVGASTQPWTIRLAHDQANTEVKSYKTNQARAIRTMLRSIVDDMQRLDHTVYVYARRTGKGGIEMDEAIGIEPEKIRSLEVEVTINPNSSAQVVAQMEHGRSLVDDPMIPVTKVEWLEEFKGETNPEEKMERWLAEQVYEGHIQPQVVTQELAKRFGSQFVVTPEGQFVGPGGQLAQPEEVLASRGINAPRVPGDVQAESQPDMPAMPGLRNPPTTVQTGGVP